MQMHTLRCHWCDKELERNRQYPVISCFDYKEKRKKEYEKIYKKTYYKKHE